MSAMRILVASVLILLWMGCSTSGYRPAEHADRHVVATVLGSEITAVQLRREDGAAATAGDDGHDKGGPEAPRRDQLGAALRAVIVAPLRQNYINVHNLHATDEEIHRYLESSRDGGMDTAIEGIVQQTRRDLEQPGLSAAQREELEGKLAAAERAQTSLKQPGTEQREMAASLIESYKFRQSIYKRYGGEVIWQQSGHEPIGALRQWLEEAEQEGRFRIRDEELRDPFWEYFRREHPFTVTDEAAISFGPPWLQKP